MCFFNSVVVWTYLIHHFNVFISFEFLFFVYSRVIWECSVRSIYYVLICSLVLRLIFYTIYFDFNRSFFLSPVSNLIIRISFIIDHSSRTYIHWVFCIFIIIIILNRIIIIFPFLSLIIYYRIKITGVIFTNLHFLRNRIEGILLLIINFLFAVEHSLFNCILFLLLTKC